MSWIDPELDQQLYEADRYYYETVRPADIALAREILAQIPELRSIEFTNCEIPLQIFIVLKTGEMVYGRNSRVGGDVTVWIFKEECDLSKGWPPEIFEIELEADAWKYWQIAEQIVEAVKQYENSLL